MDDGRDQHHRHGGDRRVAELLQLRQLRGDPGVDRRPGHQAADRRHGPEPRRQARHQRVPRRRPRLLRQRRDGVDQRAGRARGHRRHAARPRITTSRSPTTASTSAGRSCATRRGSTAPTRCRTCGWCGAPARWSTDQAEEPRREAELAGDEEGHGQLPLLRRLQDQGRPQPRRHRHPVRRADGDLPPGQRLHRLPAPRPVEVRRRPRRSARTCSCRRSTRYFNTGFVLDPVGGLDQQAGRNFVDRAVVRLGEPEPQRPAAEGLQRRRQQLRDARWARATT